MLAHSRTWSVTLLVALSALIAIHRIRTFNEPLDRDITTYAVIAHGMLDGRQIYTDIWDHKPPALYVTYALAELAVGYGPKSIYLLTVVSSICTLAGIFLISHRLGGLVGAFWATVFWVAVSGDLKLQANQPNTEVFMNACFTWILVVLSPSRPPDETPIVLLVAALATLGTLYKHVFIAPVVCLAAANVSFPPGGSMYRRRSIIQMLAVLLIVVASWLGMFGYFWSQGHLMESYETLFGYNRTYVGNPILCLAWGLSPIAMTPLILALVPVAWVRKSQGR